MHRFETTPDLATGNRDIDHQLQTLFAMVNEILFSPDLAQTRDQFRRAVNFMVSYIEYHFAAEELAMLERGYDSRRFHTAFHDHVRREARTIAANLARKGSAEEAQSAIFFMFEDWVEYRLLASYLRDHTGDGAVALPGIRPLKAAGKISADFDEQILTRVAGVA